MKITKIGLLDVKCFADFRLSLLKPGTDEPLSVCVLVGANGSGKSTILKSIVATFTMIDKEYNGELFEDSAIMKGANALVSVVNLRLNADECRRLYPENMNPYISYVHVKGEHDTIAFLHTDEEMECNEEVKRKKIQYEYFLRNFIISVNDGIVMYLDPFRFMTENLPSGPNFSNIVSKPRVGALSSNITTKGNVSSRDMMIKQWFVNLDYLRLKEDNEKNRRIYNHVIDAFDLLLSPLIFKEVDVDGNIIFLDNENNEEIEIDMLSDGFKSIFIIISEIMSRLSLIECRDNELFYEKEAIILIDEIDCHIHPRWQRNLIPSLRQLFPNCQFIITTHSPFILESLQEYEIKEIGKRKIV